MPHRSQTLTHLCHVFHSSLYKNHSLVRVIFLPLIDVIYIFTACLTSHPFHSASVPPYCAAILCVHVPVDTQSFFPATGLF